MPGEERQDWFQWQGCVSSAFVSFLDSLLSLNESRIADIHSSNTQFVLYMTGGGVSTISHLLAVPGASNTLLDAQVPYHPESLAELLGKMPEQACSEVTARQMAMVAYLKARKISSNDTVVGLGCTAALATNRERRGSDRCHIALQAQSYTLIATLTLDKADSRDQQELQCRQLAVDLMAWAADISDLPEAQNLAVDIVEAPLSWQALVTGSKNTTWSADKHVQALFPGAFNPPHAGHFEMHRTARRLLDKEVVMEISTFNVDKPPLDYIEMVQREKYLPDLPLAFTHAPTFIEKAALFPGAVFVVGVDTIIRIAQPRYYQDSDQLRDQAMETLKAGGHRFLVFGRLIKDHYQTLKDVSLPPVLMEICDEVPESEFRQDVSSTDIRNGNG